MIYGSVQDIARRLNITMPEVWVYESEDPNAFATGPSKNNSMVAVSTGLLQNLKEDEVRAAFEALAGTAPLVCRMSGSGSAIFAIYRSERDREDAQMMLGRKHGAITPAQTLSSAAPGPEPA